MPYTIDSYDGNTTFTVSDGTVDSTNTSLKLLGQNYRGYGEIIAEDFVHLLENFSKTTAPSNPIHGQVWYDKSTGSGASNKGYKLRFYDSASSSWKMVSNLVAATTAPGSPSVGDLWWDETSGEARLKLWEGTAWKGISVPTDNNYTIEFAKIYDDYGGPSVDPGVYNCLKFITEGLVIAIVNINGASDSPGPVDRLGFKPLTTAGTYNSTVYTTELDADSSTLSVVFPIIYPGITLRTEHGSSPVRRPIIGNFASNGIEDKVATLNSLGKPMISPTRAVEISTAGGAAEANQADMAVAQNQYALKIKSTADAGSASGTDSSGAALQVLGGASIAKNLYVGGNFEVEGTTSGTITEINSESLVVKDPLIQMGGAADRGDLTADDAFDRGLVMNWWDTSGTPAQKLGAIVLDDTDQKFMLTKIGTLATNAITTTTYGDIKLGNIEGLEATMTIDSTVGDMTVITSGTDKHINVTANGAGTIKTSGDILPQEVTTDVSSNDIGGASNYFSEGYAIKTFWNTACHFDGTNKATASVTMTGDYNLAAGSTLEATYADLGERFASDDIYEAGTVVKLGGLEEITKTMEEEDTDVFGIISAKPGFGLNGLAGPKETHPHVAMTGRIPCKVIGPVKKGDRLCSSEIPGVAKRADIQSVSSFAIIGRALEDFDDEGEGTVLVVVGPIN
tara:strand:+ start:111 stop:2150 length:2040 start_codon:yes stop_codon:yes gene_type:complete